MAEFIYPDARLIAGVDEVGRGPLIGAVVTAAVILDPARPIVGPADSKSSAKSGARRCMMKSKGRRWHGASDAPSRTRSTSSISCTPPCWRCSAPSLV